jgi:hypothetical protein
MGVNMLAVYAEFGERIRITPEKTATIKDLLKLGFDGPADSASCFRALLNHYPEESLLEFCLNTLVHSRPDGMGPKYHSWRKEISALAEAMRNNPAFSEWEGVFFTKMKGRHPQVAVQVWPQNFPPAA